MMTEDRSYAGILMNDGTEISHHGVKGMKWGKHLFGLTRLNGNMLNIPETDTGTRAKKESLDDHMKKYFANIQAKKEKLRQDSLKRSAQNGDSSKESTKKKKTGSGKRSSSSSKKSEDKNTQEETNKVENKQTEDKPESKPVDEKKPEIKSPTKSELPDDLVEKIQDLKYEMTPDEIKMRSEYGVKMAKELMSSLPDDPTEDQIMDLMKYESDKRGVGYDAFAIGIAIETSHIKMYNKQLKALESMYAYTTNGNKQKQEEIMDRIEELERLKKDSENALRDSLRTGRSVY